MRDLALDPETGDLLLESGRARLTSGGEAVEQRLRIRLRLWRGEYGPDTRVGLPYASILGRKGALALLRTTLRQAVATCPGVGAVDSFDATLDADRNAAVTFAARSTEGEPVSLDAFVAVGV